MPLDGSSEDQVVLGRVVLDGVERGPEGGQPTGPGGVGGSAVGEVGLLLIDRFELVDAGLQAGALPDPLGAAVYESAAAAGVQRRSVATSCN